ncbi:PREDICTED: protein EFR3 homolog B-like, partial [Lepidothrix coronata]|uniref:Protein EFR3 homolog B-like n=1 Tax=Lepidothrix coronata TaxID=321398 RepID=A0A6J0J7J9_9PASS
PASSYVCIAMEALDQLLMACHCQSINLFVESFLKMVAKLLESEKPNLQILGTNSFVKFANIEEDTPSYHRSYDFFVSRFSEMCHSGHDDPDVRSKIRMSGIKGLQGVVRKTVNDELQANIWDPQHMDKIVPSLLFNLQHVEEAESRSPSPLQATEKEKESPTELAERCLRELLGRAAYGNIKNAIKPVLIHLDNHSLWEPKVFATGCFRIIMYSIQPQHSHLVIQQLLGHLDANSRSAAPIRAGIVEVLSEAAAIAASGSVGHSRHSKAVPISAGSFASTLPPYQQSEVMVFIMNKVPLPSSQHSMEPGKDGENRNRLTQIMLLKSLLQVGMRVRNMSDPGEFLGWFHPGDPGIWDGIPGRNMSDPGEFLGWFHPGDPGFEMGSLSGISMIQENFWDGSILQILNFWDSNPPGNGDSCGMGRSHPGNLLGNAGMALPPSGIPSFPFSLDFPGSTISDISVLKLKVEKCSRQDSVFMKKVIPGFGKSWTEASAFPGLGAP